MTETTLPITPENVTVNGSKWGPKAPWAGLDFSRAELRDKATIMVFVVGEDAAPLDPHLRVPFRHPDDPPEYWERCYYRVRTRRKKDRFVKRGRAWRIDAA